MSAQKPPRGARLNRSHPLARGLVGFWLLNEGTGAKIFDLSGNGNDGTLQGNISWTNGKLGSCPYSPGDEGDYILSKDIVDGLSAVTAAAWVKTTDSGVLLGECRDHTVNAANIFRMLVGSELRVYVRNIDDTAAGAVGIIQINDGKWHHVVGVYNGNQILGYVDGKLDGTANLTGIIKTNTYNFVMMDSGIHSYAAARLIGLIDVPMVWNRALSASEITLLYREPFSMLRLGSELSRRLFIPTTVAARRSHVGFKPIEGADRLRGLGGGSLL